MDSDNHLRWFVLYRLRLNGFVHEVDDHVAVNLQTKAINTETRFSVLFGEVNYGFLVKGWNNEENNAGFPVLQRVEMPAEMFPIVDVLHVLHGLHNGKNCRNDAVDAVGNNLPLVFRLGNDNNVFNATESRRN